MMIIVIFTKLLVSWGNYFGTVINRCFGNKKKRIGRSWKREKHELRARGKIEV